MMPSVAVAPAVERAPVNKWLVTVSVTFGTLMGAIDASIVNVAIPHLRGSLGATVEEITWVTTGFVIATVLVMPLTAFLGRMFGQKRVYLACLALFVVGSALCGMARSLPALVVFRALQGLGAGALQPTEQAILRQTFPPKEQGMAMAFFGLAVMIGPAVGPTLGGYIVDHYSWPWIFYINVPVGILGFFMVTRFVHEPEDVRAANRAGAELQRRHMDWAGIAFLTIGLSAMQYVLEEGNRNDWFDSRLIVALTVVAVFAIAFFIARELTATAPAVNLSLFKDTVFLSGTLIGGIMFAMLLASMFLLPVYMQELLGFTATQSGISLMPRVIVMMVTTPLLGRLYGKVSARLLVAGGVICTAIGAWQMSHFNLQTSLGGVIAASIIQGVGFSALFIVLTTVALSNVPRTRLTDATGLNSLVRQVGGSIGLAVFATLLSRYATVARVSIGAHLFPGNPLLIARLAGTRAALVARGFDPVSAEAAGGRALGGAILRQSMMLSFDKLFLLSAMCFLAILPLVLFLKEGHQPGPKPEVHLE